MTLIARIPLAALLTVIVGHLTAARCDLVDEKRCQADLAGALDRAGLIYIREYRLSAGDVVDFFVDGRIAIEVKLKGAGRAAVARQLRRYAQHPAVEGVVLVANIAMRLPPSIAGKPAAYVSLGRGWL